MLTKRKFEILALLCKGLSNKEIAKTLNLSPQTVKVHLSEIFRELNVKTRLSAVLEAQKRGFFEKTR